MTALRYRSNVSVDDLQIDECTIHRAGTEAGPRWWLLWFRVNHETDGHPFDIAVPINPNGGFIGDGPGGKTWGLTQSGPDTWQIAPSINVLPGGEIHEGSAGASQWHQTPALVDVPLGEAWQIGAP